MPMDRVNSEIWNELRDLEEHQVALQALEPDEKVEARARTDNAVLVVTDRRVAVAADQRLALDVSFDRLRRVQFDIERARPATLVLVPEHPSDYPQVLAIPPQVYADVANALVVIGERLVAPERPSG